MAHGRLCEIKPNKTKTFCKVLLAKMKFKSPRDRIVRIKFQIQETNFQTKNTLKKKNITFLGVTFQAGTDDVRDSPALSLIPVLLRNGAKISYYDPTGKKNEFNHLKGCKYMKNIKENCKDADLIILHTEWDEFKSLEFNKIVKKKNFKIYDLRNLYSLDDMFRKKINYYSVGRSNTIKSRK